MNLLCIPGGHEQIVMEEERRKEEEGDIPFFMTCYQFDQNNSN